MKKINFLSVFVLICATLNFTSCDDIEPIDPQIVIPTDQEPEPEVPEGGLFKVDIDGQTYTATATTVYISGGSIMLNALRPLGDSFGMIIDGATTGTYAANENLIAYTQAGTEYGYWSFHPSNPTADTGNIVITEIDAQNNTISGTFEYTGYWSDDATTQAPKEFTNGVFTDLPYVTESPTGDSFYAKVNGSEFVDTFLLPAVVEVNGQEFITINAKNAATNTINLNIDSSVPTGTYPLTGNPTADSVQFLFALSEDDFGEHASSGSVTITEKTADRIKGTFSATVTINEVVYQITSGAFDVGY